MTSDKHHSRDGKIDGGRGGVAATVCLGGLALSLWIRWLGLHLTLLLLCSAHILEDGRPREAQDITPVFCMYRGAWVAAVCEFVCL